MNNILKIREEINKANRLYEAQILATKNVEITPYRRSFLNKGLCKHKKKCNFKLNYFSYSRLLKEYNFDFLLLRSGI